jgi:hypothetical protein
MIEAWWVRISKSPHTRSRGSHSVLSTAFCSISVPMSVHYCCWRIGCKRNETRAWVVHPEAATDDRHPLHMSSLQKALASWKAVPYKRAVNVNKLCVPEMVWIAIVFVNAYCWMLNSTTIDANIEISLTMRICARCERVYPNVNSEKCWTDFGEIWYYMFWMWPYILVYIHNMCVCVIWIFIIFHGNRNSSV